MAQGQSTLEYKLSLLIKFKELVVFLALMSYLKLL